MSVTLVLGLGRETRDWLAGGHATTTEVVVADERPGLHEDDPVLAMLGDGLTLRTEVDLDGPATALLAPLVAADVTLVVRSPGVSPYRRALQELAVARVPVVTPTGWWLDRARPQRLAAITGTKGKSTTAAMTAHVLDRAGVDVALCGNIGTSPLTGVDPERQTVVIELSSYQLADLHAPIPVGGVTTLLRDHVPWHGSVERYHADKMRLLDLAELRLASPEAARHPAVADRVDAVAGVAAIRPPLTAALAHAGLLGEHLVDDAALAVALADALLTREGAEVDPAVLYDALRDFEPLPHRLTPVGELDGVRFVDDSISTVPEAALAALAAYRPAGPVTLLLGGDDRGQDTAALVAAISSDPHVRAVFLSDFGRRLAADLAAAGSEPHVADDLAGAVRRAAEVTPSGGTVLLSPAAPSFGTHRDFVHRGEDFAATVAALGSNELRSSAPTGDGPSPTTPDPRTR